METIIIVTPGIGNFKGQNFGTYLVAGLRFRKTSTLRSARLPALISGFFEDLKFSLQLFILQKF
jgi:hypothetical protein